MIDRRAFLRRLGFGTVSAAAAAATFDLERLLWVPDRVYVFPAVPAWPAEAPWGSWVSPEWLAKEALRILERNLTFAKVVNREYDAAFVGQRVRIRRPERWTA